MKRSLSNAIVGLMLVVVAGCGFHLRGTANLSDSLKTMYIQGVNTQQELGRELKRALMSNDVLVLSDYQMGSAVLTVLEHKVERRVLSVGSDAKANEYELYGTVRFNVTDENGTPMSTEQKVEASRDYRFDQDQVLASENEEGILRQQLNQQLAQSILRRLSVLK